MKTWTVEKTEVARYLHPFYALDMDKISFLNVIGKK
jgi:hypothetical protein